MITETPSARFGEFSGQVYARVLRLYPAQFVSEFAEEMVEVFVLSVSDAAQRGIVPLMSVIMREVGDLPVNLLLVHIFEWRKKKMVVMKYDSEREVAAVRWVARILSLIVALLVISVVIFNEDVRQNPTLPTLALGFTTILMLASWRWERIGGMLTMIASPLIVLATSVMATQAQRADFLLAFVVGLALASVPAVIGWLFLSVGQHHELGLEAGAERSGSKIGRVVAVVFIVLFIIVALVFSGVAAPFQEMQSLEPGMTPGVPIIETSP